MSSVLSAFNWRGQPSTVGKSLIKATGTAPPAKNHPMRKAKPKLSQDNAFTGAGCQIKPERQPPAVYKTPGLVTPSNNGFSIPSRLQAQADTDRRRGIVKGGI